MPARDPAERAENEAYEQLAALDLLRGRTLSDAGVALVHHGDTVAVTAAGVTVQGRVLHAAGDLLCLRTPTGDVDVHLAAAAALRVLDAPLEAVDDTGAAVSSSAAGPPSFKARLFEHEAVGARLEFGVAGLQAPPCGRLVAVAVDHAVVEDTDAQRWLLPLRGIAWARPAPP